MATTTLPLLPSGTPTPTGVFHFVPAGGTDKSVTLAGVLTALGVQSATVAGLGTPASGNPWKYATNGRKLGETAGNGTGVLVRWSGSAWRTVDQDSIVSA